MEILYLSIAAGFFFASIWLSLVSNRNYCIKLDDKEKENI